MSDGLMDFWQTNLAEVNRLLDDEAQHPSQVHTQCSNLRNFQIQNEIREFLQKIDEIDRLAEEKQDQE